MKAVPVVALSRRGGLVPRVWRRDVAAVLIPEERLARRVRALARRIQKDYQGRDLVLVALLSGTLVFLADLIRHLTLPLRLDFIGVSSYGAGTVPGRLVFTKELKLDVAGRDVLVVDDILDTGRTLRRVLEKLEALRPRSLRVCVLLEKKGRRVEPVKADYVGFEIPDLFVVGYGLDYAERYRHLPFVGVLHPQLLDGAEVVETERGSARNGPAARHSAGRTARRV
ncbi:hypoxanthine phosphoribosyltransferase [Limisphaera sp. VF-2]|jgi:hypoxanthine phosphoribosyltransferase|uniref:hypoxanthine phosphoribosyltransferase n=1 Tax=Limisphaera sp. VF-2 TaxID=3400418 RepID=UPI001777D498|nr:hypoxanthine phosphoribosyltransferase [Limisphaera sp.]